MRDYPDQFDRTTDRVHRSLREASWHGPLLIEDSESSLLAKVLGYTCLAAIIVALILVATGWPA